VRVLLSPLSDPALVPPLQAATMLAAVTAAITAGIVRIFMASLPWGLFRTVRRVLWR
jgi:hypothetical protein